MLHPFKSLAFWALTAGAQAWSPGVQSPAAVSDLAVDSSDRDDVISFYQNIYKASEDYAAVINWNGNMQSCNAGTLPEAFIDKMRRRVNYYRAMAGVPASIVMNDTATIFNDQQNFIAPAQTLKSHAAQRAAFFMSRNTILTHTPASHLPCYTIETGNGCYFSNIALGVYGVKALEYYMREDRFNPEAGHRRYILFNRATNFATGDVPSTGQLFSANALYVFQKEDELATVEPSFIAWPPAGFCPWTDGTEYFSLGYPGANFTNATVSISRNGVPVEIAPSEINRTQGFANNSIVWRVPGFFDDNNQLEDVVYQVTVANIGGNGPSSHTYSVTFINAEHLTQAPTLTGPQRVSPGGSGGYAIGPIDIAEEYRLEVGRRSSLPTTTIEGGEDATAPLLIPGPVIGAGYNIRSTTYRRTGLRSLNVAFTRSNQREQWIEMDRVLIPKAGATISYHRRMSFVSPSSSFAVQYCINDDGLWKDIPGTTAVGTSFIAESTEGRFSATTATRETERSFTPQLNISLPDETIDTPTRIRVILRQTSPAVFVTTPTNPSGVFVDDISFNEVDWLSERHFTAYPKNASEVTLDAITAGGPLTAGGNYTMRIQPRVGQTLMRSSPMIEVVASDNERPTLDAIASPIEIQEDAATQILALTGISAGLNENQNLTVTAISHHPSLIPHPSIQYSSPNSFATLTFTPALHQSGTARISVTVDDGQSDNHTIVRTFWINVTAVNDAPTVLPIGDRSINEGGSLIVPFTIADVDHPISAITVSASSSNSELLPSSSLLLSGSGANRRLTMRPIAKRFGEATISITVSDGQDSSTTSFLLTVNNVNDLPTLDVIPNLVITEDDPTQTITLTGISAGPFEDQPLTVTAVSSRPLIIPHPAISYQSPNNTATLSFTPLPDAHGVVNITVSVNDGQLTRSNFARTFRVTVRPVNDRPSITALEDITIHEDTPSAPLPFTISDVETAPARLRLSRVSSNTALLPTSRITFGGTGNLRHAIVNPAPNQFGTAVVTISVSDGSLVDSTTFTVTVNPVNDAPTIAIIRSPVTINEDAAEQTITLTGITSGAPNEMQNLTITATSSNTALIPHPSVIYTSPETSALLRYQPQPNLFGTAVITVTVQDDADVNHSFSRNFTVNVRSINDAPTITPIPAQTIQRDGVSSALHFTIADVETDATELIVNRASNNLALIPVANIVMGGTAGERTVTITPALNRTGTATITLSVSDGAATTRMAFMVTVVEPVLAPLAIMMDAAAVSDFADLSYEDWIAQYDPKLWNAAFDDDFDEDGLTNGVEYAFDRNPTQADSIGELQVDLTIKTMHLLVTLPTLRSQLIYTAERSDDLQQWTAEGVTLTHEEGVLRASCAMGEKARYLRWKVTRK